MGNTNGKEPVLNGNITEETKENFQEVFFFYNKEKQYNLN